VSFAPQVAAQKPYENIEESKHSTDIWPKGGGIEQPLNEKDKA